MEYNKTTTTSTTKTVRKAGKASESLEAEATKLPDDKLGKKTKTKTIRTKK